MAKRKIHPMSIETDGDKRANSMSYGVRVSVDDPSKMIGDYPKPPRRKPKQIPPPLKDFLHHPQLKSHKK